ncbi:SLC13 family permease [Hippea alviniae]|uniref:SLC13 family permease n=1 Tax=Hippea alviniae TaxID=1279027 RepID=UPI0012DCC94A|nr:SLC13 family permease [Hippea alviniae]
MNFWLRKLLKEWLFLFSTIGAIITSIYLKRIPHYSVSDFNVLFIIFSFLVVLKGLQNSKALYFVAAKIGLGRFVGLKLIFLTLILAMFLTNDISLLLVVPITILMDVENKDMLVILEAIAANASSALLPSGNPQNMFIYWFYSLNLFEFVKAIYPFCLVSVVLLVIFALLFKFEGKSLNLSFSVEPNYKLYLILLVLMIAVILKFVPIWTGLIVVFYAVLFDRDALKIDYFLLGIFFMFFGFTDNLAHILRFSFTKGDSVFVFSALFSQLISNVPSALFFADFTNNWKALLWGVSVGGYGNLIGSLANLIAYRIYVSHVEESKKFLWKFMVIGYFFFFSLFLFRILYNYN